MFARSPPQRKHIINQLASPLPSQVYEFVGSRCGGRACLAGAGAGRGFSDPWRLTVGPPTRSMTGRPTALDPKPCRKGALAVKRAMAKALKWEVSSGLRGLDAPNPGMARRPALVKAGLILAGHRIDRPVFSSLLAPRPRAHDPGIMGPRICRRRGSPASRSMRLRGRPVGEMASKRSRSKTAPALHLLDEIGETEMKTEGTRNNPGRIRTAHAAEPPLGPEAAQRRKKALGVGASP